MSGISVDRPPKCPECGVVLDYLDDYVVSHSFRCPECRRGFTTPRSPATKWDRVEFNFDYKKAPHPIPYEIAWAEDEWV